MANRDRIGKSLLDVAFGICGGWKERRNPEFNSLSDMEMRIPEPKNTDANEEDLLKLQLAICQLKKVDRAIIFLYLEEKSYQEKTRRKEKGN